MSNLAYKEEYKEEVLNGEIVLMSPSPSINHNIIASNITTVFKVYLADKKCMVFQDGVDLYLSEKDIVVPDMAVVCNKDIIKDDGIYGAPSLIVEVLSPSTAKNDKGYKKYLYERYGVQEYWIVSPKETSVEVNILEDGKYKIDSIYYSIKGMTEKEKENKYVESFKCSLFDDLVINIEDIFRDIRV